MRRSDQRRAAVIAAYQHDLTGQPLAEALGATAGPFTSALAQAAVEHADEFDELIGRHAHGWTVARIAPLERSILRVALVEMLHGDEVPAERPITAEGAIDEAVESAKTFCGADAPGFVNGILDAILREVRENATHERT
ncbi:MAG TPA: transcription antitermination protein NusB [Solirubrobacteraceae bacterium]|nr:transcription antitermination protein NusB [Solirubrobacteraceae bacterium]